MKEGVWAHQISLLMHPFKNAMTKGVYDYNAIAVKGESEEPEAINLEEFLSNVDDDQLWRPESAAAENSAAGLVTNSILFC